MKRIWYALAAVLAVVVAHFFDTGVGVAMLMAAVPMASTATSSGDSAEGSDKTDGDGAAQDAKRKVVHVEMTPEMLEALTAPITEQEVRAVMGGATPMETIPVVRLAEEVKETRVVRERDDNVWLQTHRLLKRVCKGDRRGVFDQIEKMIDRQYYAGNERFEKLTEEARESRAIALTSAEGAPFLPTTVMNVLQSRRETYGMGRQVVTVLTLGPGTTKVPASVTIPDPYAVGEGVEIQSRKGAFTSISLDPKSWGVIMPYSAQMRDEVGAAFLQRTVESVGIGFARLEDRLIWIADGTSTYNNITGLFSNANVPVYTMGAGDTSLSALDRTDINGLRKAVDYRGRISPNAAYVFHPDVGEVLADFQDPSGSLIFPQNDLPTGYRGAPFRYTAALPDETTIDGSPPEKFGTFGDHSFIVLGVQKEVTVALLDQATILDPDTQTRFSLGAGNALALRFVTDLDVALNNDFADQVAAISTAAS